MKYSVTPGSDTNSIKFNCLVPQSIPGRQKIGEMKISPEPSRKFEQGGNAYAEFQFERPKKPIEIAINVTAEIYRYDLSVASTENSHRQLEDRAELKKWLVDERYLEKDAPDIQSAAKALAGKSDEETVRNTMAFVGRTMRKGPFDSADHGAVWALEKKLGDCTEYSDLFIALCRANGVPARSRGGYVVIDVARGDTPKHDWAEAYIGKAGWVPFDPLHTQQGSATVDKLRPIYIYLDNQRRNPVLFNYHYFAYRYEGDKAQVQDGFELKSRKLLVPD